MGDVQQCVLLGLCRWWAASLSIEVRDVFDCDCDCDLPTTCDLLQSDQGLLHAAGVCVVVCVNCDLSWGDPVHVTGF